MAEPLLRLENLSKYYTSAQTVAIGLNGVSLNLDRGEFVAVTGESGSGKSTLAHVISGILPYEAGEMYFMGKPTSHFDGGDYEQYRRDHVSFISQSYGILPGCSVMENVVAALRFSGQGLFAARRRAKEILREVELWKLHNRRAGKLSSGQKQRLSIARALAKDSPILVADEPTGNLDPENSAKVMELLAKAAKDRLVILITHEFSEAEALVSRHIVIQDGQIAMDAVLQPAEPVSEETGKTKKRRKRLLSGYVARMQLAGRPVWATLVLLFFALTAFAVFAFLGNLIIALDDTGTRIYDNSAFQNGDKNRIVVIRSDGGPMRLADYQRILFGEHVVALEPHGYVADVNYAYRENVDYRWENLAVDKGSADDPDMSLTRFATMMDDAPFLQTVPMLPEGVEFLKAGRLPKTAYEVVLCADADKIGTTIQVFLRDTKHWSVSTLLPLEVTVVGVTDYGEGLFFHGDVGMAFTHSIAHSKDGCVFLPAEDLEGDEVRCSEYMYNSIRAKDSIRISFRRGDAEGTSTDINDPEVYKSLYIIVGQPQEDGTVSYPKDPWHNLQMNNFFQVSREAFGELVYSDNCEQISLTVEDYAYTDRVLDWLQSIGYYAMSPFREGSTEVDPELAAERLQTLIICGVALVAILVLQMTVLRALFGTQTETYKLLSNIGLTCGPAKRSLLRQVLLFAVAGQLLGAAGLLLCRDLEVERIVYILRYLPPQYLALLSGVHMAVSLLGAVWVMRSMAKQVFPLTGKRRDLPMGEKGVKA